MALDLSAPSQAIGGSLLTIVSAIGCVQGLVVGLRFVLASIDDLILNFLMTSIISGTSVLVGFSYLIPDH